MLWPAGHLPFERLYAGVQDAGSIGALLRDWTPLFAPQKHTAILAKLLNDLDLTSAEITWLRAVLGTFDVRSDSWLRRTNRRVRAALRWTTRLFTRHGPPGRGADGGCGLVGSVERGRPG